MSPAAHAAKKSAKAIARKRKKKQPRPQLPLTRKFYSIPEFCLVHRISRSGFYNLAAAGKAPVVTAVGSKRLISEEAASAWRAQLPIVEG